MCVHTYVRTCSHAYIYKTRLRRCACALSKTFQLPIPSPSSLSISLSHLSIPLLSRNSCLLFSFSLPLTSCLRDISSCILLLPARRAYM